MLFAWMSMSFVSVCILCLDCDGLRFLLVIICLLSFKLELYCLYILLNCDAYKTWLVTFVCDSVEVVSAEDEWMKSC